MTRPAWNIVKPANDQQLRRFTAYRFGTLIWTGLRTCESDAVRDCLAIRTGLNLPADNIDWCREPAT